MRRTVTALCLAATFGVVVTLGAQTPQTPTGTTGTATATADQRNTSRDTTGEVTITGCLARDSRGMFTLNNAMMDSTAASTTTAGASTTTAGTSTTTAGTSTTTTGTTGTTTTAEPKTGDTHSMANWSLSGNSSDLERHVGHKIQVTGTVANMTSGSSGTPAYNPPQTSTANPPQTSTTGTTGTITGGTATTGGKQRSRDSNVNTPARQLNVKSVKMISASCS